MTSAHRRRQEAGAVAGLPAAVDLHAAQLRAAEARRSAAPRRRGHAGLDRVVGAGRGSAVVVVDPGRRHGDRVRPAAELHRGVDCQRRDARQHWPGHGNGRSLVDRRARSAGDRRRGRRDRSQHRTLRRLCDVVGLDTGRDEFRDDPGSPRATAGAGPADAQFLAPLS